MTITTTKNTAARVSRYVRLLKRLKNSLQMKYSQQMNGENKQG